MGGASRLRVIIFTIACCVLLASKLQGYTQKMIRKDDLKLVKCYNIGVKLRFLP